MDKVPDTFRSRGLYLLGLLGGVLPLWWASAVPMVDLPQHLHLISVLHRLDDATTLYPEFLARRPQLTPYLGYYYAVSLLNWLLPLELANRVFLTAYVAGLPLSLAFLLRSLKRPAWPSLLAVPFAYGDSFGWGFVNYCAALPLGFLTCGLFVRAIEDAPRRRRWAYGLAASLVAVLLFHVQVFGYLAVALPWLLATTPAPDSGKSFKSWLLVRRDALLGVVPGVALFTGWIGMRIGQPAEIAPGEPWKAWGPMLSPENLSYKPFGENRNELFPVLSGLLRDQSDSRAVVLAFVAAGLGAALALGLWLKTLKGNALRNQVALLAACAVAGIAAWPAETPTRLAILALAAGVALTVAGSGDERLSERARLPGLALFALLLFFALPFDIRGFVYYLNTRYAHLFAAVAVCCVPALEARFHRWALVAGAAVAVSCGWPLAKGFEAFELEAKPLEELWKWAPEKPKVMGLIFGTGSRTMTHPVFLHASTAVARARGGVTNFSFATTPHSPLMYREGKTPPTFPSEWQPQTMSWEKQGYWYDTFVLRGASPEQVFTARLQSGELEVATRQGDFWLVRRPLGR